jgi:hypothetical protein
VLGLILRKINDGAILVPPMPTVGLAIFADIGMAEASESG